MAPCSGGTVCLPAEAGTRIPEIQLGSTLHQLWQILRNWCDLTICCMTFLVVEAGLTGSYKINRMWSEEWWGAQAKEMAEFSLSDRALRGPGRPKWLERCWKEIAGARWCWPSGRVCSGPVEGSHEVVWSHWPFPFPVLTAMEGEGKR